MAVRRDHPGDVGLFHFLEEGLRLGRHALDRDSTDGANLVIVDEFGPLELASRGWRGAVDSLIRADRMPLVVVVRRELTDAVRGVYANVPCRLLDATAPESIDEVLRSVREDAST